MVRTINPVRTSYVLTIGLMCGLALPVAARAQTSPSTPVAKSGKGWTPPKTSWGDPDISGNFTNIDEVATPLERPDQLAGRRLEDISGKELADLRYKAQFALKDRFDNDNGIHAQTSFWGWEAHGQGSQAWFVTEPADGKIPPLTQDGQKRTADAARRRAEIASRFATDYRDYTLYDRCITRGLPGSMMPAMYGDSYQIVQTPGLVAIRYEMVHETRIIPLDARPHAGSKLRFDMGDARGHWDGNTLVVESTNFSDRSAFRNADGKTLHLIERFTRVAPDKVRWEVTVDDPSTWTRPWSFGLPLRMDDREAILEYACHEGNLGLENLIHIASLEQAAAER
jgi:hypothetical protein